MTIHHRHASVMDPRRPVRQAGRPSMSIGNLILMACLAGCQRPAAPGWQGYVEGDFLYLGPSVAGRIESVAIAKGAEIQSGTELFRLERTHELAAVREAAGRVDQLAARLDDLRKGLRPTEIASLESRIAQARAGAELSSRQLERVSALFKKDTSTADEFDRARLTHAANTHLVTDLESQLRTAQLGGRADVVRAAEADLETARATQARAQWGLDQRTLASPTNGLIHDIIHRPGEQVSAGNPVVVLLPPGNIKVRFFLSEADLGGVRVGDAVRVTLSGRPSPFPARITYISTKPEFTPPVLYNRENRSKLVYMLEAVPTDPAVAKALHPGQPVDVAR